MYKFNELNARRFPLKEWYNVTLVTNIPYLTQLTFRTIDTWLNNISEADKFTLIKLRKKYITIMYYLRVITVKVCIK